VPASPPQAAARSARSAVSVVVGDEELLVERAITRLVAEVSQADEASQADDTDETGDGNAGNTGGIGGGIGADADVRELAAARLSQGELISLVSPSLFGGDRAVIIRGIQDASKEVAAELERYATSPESDVVLVLTHAGGAKGKAVLTALTSRGVRVIRCPKITRADERMEFVRDEFRRLGRRVDQSGLRTLIDAVGTDLSELAAAAAQLNADIDGAIDEPAVARYYRGRAEASGFTVADRAVEGNLGGALEYLRWALSTGVAPVLISSALAQGVRALGKVGAVPRGKSNETLAGQLGMPPWKIDRVKRQLRGWTPTGVATALQAVAEADAQVKGEGASAGYALERVIRRIVACRD
jgi:DNA polymerase-3 subunit delta